MLYSGPKHGRPFIRWWRRDGTDAIRKLYPTEKIYTFLRLLQETPMGRDAGLRIDHFLLRPAVKPAPFWLPVSTATYAAGKKTSDHCPVWIELGEG